MIECPAPGCFVQADEDDLDWQRDHMTQHHPQVVEDRLVAAKFQRPSVLRHAEDCPARYNHDCRGHVGSDLYHPPQPCICGFDAPLKAESFA